MKIYVLDRVFDYMVNLGMDEETEVFEDILHCIVECACDQSWDADSFDKTLLARGCSRKWARIRAKYCSEECPEPYPTQTEVFMTWKMALREQLDLWSLGEVLEELKLVAGGAKGEWEDAHRVSFGKGIGAAASAADAAEQACHAGLSEYGAESGRCAGADPGPVEAECLDNGEEDEEEETDWFPGTFIDGPAEEFGEDVGVSGPEPGEPSDQAGRVEGRKKSFGSLPPMSEYRTSLYAQGVCR